MLFILPAFYYMLSILFYFVGKLFFFFFCHQMMEDAVHFLSKETIVQAIARSTTKVSLLLP